jgi:hypothetical protein
MATDENGTADNAVIAYFDYVKDLGVPFWAVVLGAVFIILAFRFPAILSCILTFMAETKRIDIDAEHKKSQIDVKIKQLEERRKHRESTANRRNESKMK